MTNAALMRANDEKVLAPRTSLIFHSIPSTSPRNKFDMAKVCAPPEQWSLQFLRTVSGQSESPMEQMVPLHDPALSLGKVRVDARSSDMKKKAGDLMRLTRGQVSS